MAKKTNISRDKLDAALAVARRRFGHRKNVSGFDVGYKWVQEEPTKELCIRVHVVEKIEVSQLEASEVFPSEIDGVPLDVIRGPYKAKLDQSFKNPLEHFPVLMGGISCGRIDVGTGTLGAIVIDNNTGKPLGLSNWHVLHGPTGAFGDPIVQPGPADARPVPANQIGTLSRSILDADGDAALAELNMARPWMPVQNGIQNSILQEMRNSRLGETLEKSGRTTGLTKGRVDGEGFYRVEYEISPEVFEVREITGFKLVPVTPGNPNNEELSSGGDSGSVWFHRSSNQMVGLHFAGETNVNPRAEHAIACNMTTVANRLNFRPATTDDLVQFFQSTQQSTVAAAQSRAPRQSRHDQRWPQSTWPSSAHDALSEPWETRDYPEHFDWDRDQSANTNQHWRNPAFSDRYAPAVEALDDPRFISVRNYIWPRLRRALVAKNSSFADVKPLDPLVGTGGRFSNLRGAYEFVARAVNASPEFQSDGVLVRAADFRGDKSFAHAANTIGDIYEQFGYSVES